ncbi:MAG: type I polyketide synthase [Planctomycetes bacterium]|nr:type I polyketide synthase [Planctomycetota bacterium]
MPGTDNSERIAIVGVGGIFPSAPELNTFWSNIAAGIDAGRHVPAGRWYLSPEQAYAPWPPQPDRVYSTWGCYIEDFSLDPTGLDLEPALIRRLDPMFHLGLHAARAAYRDARQLRGIDPARIGVILGNIALPTESTSAMCRDVLGRTFIEKLIGTAALAAQTALGGQPTPWSAALADPAAAAALKSRLGRSDWHPWNRFAAGLPASLIGHALGLEGIAFTLDAACASSLYSLKFAAEELLSHRADAMLAGGMSRPDCQYTQMGFAQLQALSRRGCCAPLSAAADGLVVGEGAGVFVLKRLRDAVACADHIYGVIAGIGLSNDRGANLLAPHSEGQLRAMRSAYEQAGWKPSDVDLIECHATGTPVGDAVEISSLHQLWKQEFARPRQCVIGGVKSNVGHLLTGAGAAGLMKVLLAVKHATLPPTANFEQPAELLAASDSPFRVLRQSEPWQRRGSETSAVPTPRRATVNAFGFGGINAHVLIEEWIGTHVTARSSSGVGDAPLQVAVVGFDAQVMNRESKNEVLASEFQGTPDPYVDLNWWGIEQTGWFHREISSSSASPVGRGITEVRLPMGQFRIPPLEMQDMLPQQQVMLKVAHGALGDVKNALNPNLNPPKSPDTGPLENRTGVFIGIELDPNTTNFHFRWSIEQDGPTWARYLGLDLTADQLTAWISSLKDAAGPPLTPNRVMGNLGGIVASRLAREFDVGGPSFTVSCGRQSDLIALHLAARALERGELDRAIVGGVELSTDPRWNLLSTSPTAATAGESGNTLGSGSHYKCTAVDQATAIVVQRFRDAMRDQNRCYGVFKPSSPHISANKQTSRERLLLQFPLTGEVGIAGTLPIVVPAAYHELDLDARRTEVPANSDWAGGQIAPFRFRSAPDQRTVRTAGPTVPEAIRYDIESVDEPQSHLVNLERRRPIGEFPFAVFVIDGDSQDELVQTLEELSRICQMRGSVEQVAIRWFHAHPPRHSRRWALTLVAGRTDELPALIAAGRQRLSGDVTAAASLSKQVFYSPNPAGQQGRVAFVFPGSGNAFRRMGRTLLSVFPEVLRRQQHENVDLASQYAAIWNSRQEFDNHKSMIFSQVAIGTGVCDLLALFDVRPTASIGYSLGESAALFGLRAWTERDEMLRRMEQSPLFGSDLVPPFDAARKAWKIPEGQPVPWLSGVVDRSAAEIRAAIEQMRVQTGPALRLYLLIINTPRQCVIGGDREQVQQLVQGLNATFIPLASPSTVHCEVLRQVEPAYRELHLMQTTAPATATTGAARSIDFYSAAWGHRYDLTRESAAEAIVAQAVDTIDFPRVIHQAHADGVRVFIEIGPGSSCTRMIDEILGDRPHFARSALPVTSRPVEAFLELLAALIAERVPVDLSYLYGQPPTPEPLPPIREVVTRVGGLAFQIPVPPGGWRFLPAPVSTPPSPEPVVELPLVAVEPSPSLTMALPAESCEAPAVSIPTVNDVTIATTNHDNGFDVFDPPLSLWDQFQAMTDQHTQAHETFLRLSARYEQLAAEHLATLARAGAATSAPAPPEPVQGSTGVIPKVISLTVPVETAIPVEPPRSLNRQQCMEFAVGKIGRVLGQKFAEIDQHPTRVRLPDEPLMLVDRILSIEGEPLSMTSGRVITEHDIHPGAWYLDCGRIPTCIAVESGQADLFLSGWLGIDFETRGVACYRLLDAVVTFHDALPQAGQTIHYDIRVLHFFRQGSTYLFRFEFDATVDGRPLLTMREGCAGFFTDAELAGGKGIIHTALDKRPRPGNKPADWNDPVPMAVESYDDQQLLALRRGDLATCFGPAFADLPVRNPVTLPGLVTQGGSSPARSRMWLIDRVLKLDPVGGKFGMGTILGELDIHPDDWFLVCHFCDDQVMPGTLMYECCLHTLRIHLLRMGWIGEAGQVVYEPIPEVRSRLKCRGQVLSGTRKVWYEVTLKEIGYGGRDGLSTADATSAYCLADALMYADGKPIVEITDMSVRLTGLTKESVTRLWQARHRPVNVPIFTPRYDRRPAIFDTDRVTAFAIGKPSDAFGDRYKPFDEDRKIARLPGPPFQFLDRIVSIQNCQPWVLQAGGEIIAQYDVPIDAWYFKSNRQRTMPFAVLLETALQPCGWLAGYLGSALTSDTDLSFRNLGGTATQFREVTAQSGTLTTTVKITRVSNSAGMIIQHYDFDLRCDGEPVYVGNTYFGFFSKAALSNQIGIRDATPYQPNAREMAIARRGPYPVTAPFSDEQFRMIQTIESLVPNGGPYGHGCIVGTMPVDPDAWFFKAHFYQDPVVPGSLGLESFWQLLKLFAADRWQARAETLFVTPSMTPAPGTNAPAKHEWVYRGQVIPRDKLVTVTAVIRDVDDDRRTVTAEGFLSVDGRVIYQMKNFILECQS